jgi:effector-binding domain-containing protein
LARDRAAEPSWVARHCNPIRHRVKLRQVQGALPGQRLSAEDAAAMTIAITEIEPQAVLIMKAERVPPAQIGPTLVSIHPRIRAFLRSRGIAPTGAPFANYTHMHADGSMEIEAGFPVPDGTKGEGEILAGELQGGKAATTTHVGPYATLSGTWDRLKKWLEHSGHRKGRDACEVYIDIEKEGTVPDTELKTTVYILLKA